MADQVLEARTWLPHPRALVWRLLADPASPAHLSPPWLAWRLAGPPPEMAAWTVLDYRVRWMGIPLRWRSFVREWDPPVRFVDVQVRGPFARWEHRHLLLEEADGTVVEDRVTYRLPLGPLGAAAHALLVERQLQAAWAFRRRRMAALLGAGPAGAPGP